MTVRDVEIPIGKGMFPGNLSVPENASGLVVFAHGSGSSRKSQRNRRVARFLNERGFATLLFDLLTEREENVDMMTGSIRFDIDLLSGRLGQATDWARGRGDVGRLGIGYFGAGTGSAAALTAAAERVDIRAIVSRGGRPDLAGDALERVTAPVLLVVGGRDLSVIELNRAAARRMITDARLEIVEKAGHLFEEPGALDTVAELAVSWFGHFLRTFSPQGAEGA